MVENYNKCICEICDKREASVIIKGDCGICILKVCKKCSKLDIAMDVFGWSWNLKSGEHILKI